MSSSELERLVCELEADPSLQQPFRDCRSRQQLILTARRMGYRITRVDLQRAWMQEQQAQQPQQAQHEPFEQQRPQHQLNG
jgi:DNA-binding winged helix-turn-helix (wHTH) protein